MKLFINKKIEFIIMLCFLVLLTLSCSQKQGKNITPDKNFSMQIEEIENQKIIEEIKEIDTSYEKTTELKVLKISDLIVLLDKTIDFLPDINDYKKEKVTIEDNEEYAPDWFGVKYFDGDKLIFVAESNWINKESVSRITLYSEQIKERELFVSQTFGNIRNLIDNEIPTAPDGELHVRLKKHPEITVLLDISNVPDTSPLYYGGASVSEIPDSLRVDFIVIMKRD